MGDAIEIGIRKHQMNLVKSGSAVVRFGLWTVIKVLIIGLAGKEVAVTVAKQYFSADQVMEFVKWIEDARIIAVLIVFFIPYILIGIWSKKEGKGKKTMPLHVILSVIIVALTLMIDVGTLFAGQLNLASILMTIVDLTCCFAMLQVIISSGKLRSLRRMRS